jgi:hypothetical protein
LRKEREKIKRELKEYDDEMKHNLKEEVSKVH